MHLKKLLLFILTLISGYFLLLHQTLYQPLLAQGDHGRDLYAFSLAYEGEVPYRDYWWVYGPLMPYYYGLFFKVLGVSIPSVLFGKLILNLIAGAFFLLILSKFIPPLLSYIGTLWFWMFHPDFFFTYNHIGGVAMLLAATYCIILYIHHERLKSLGWALVGIFILSLIKVNFSVTSLVILLIALLATDILDKNVFTRQKKLFLFIALIGLPSIVFLIYFLLFQGQPIYVIRQCLPYIHGDQPYSAPVWFTTKMLINNIYQNINASWIDRMWALLIIVSFIQTSIQLLKPKWEFAFKKKFILCLGIIFISYIFNLHEFLVSGVFYRSFWAQSFSLLMVLLVIGTASLSLSRILQRLLALTLFVIIFMTYLNQIQIVRHQRIPEQFLDLERGQITTGNSYEWFNTVKQTTLFLKSHLKDKETFFALPYDPLYYYLVGKLSPTRQLIFFDHIKIPPEQEKKVIEELKDNRVSYVVLSSRTKALEHGLGTFGETYCPMIKRYIDEHFAVVATFGDWVNEPGWAWNHGTKILKRIKD